jgi:hypothetical protein
MALGVLFWKDCWIGNTSLCAKYLELFCFACDQDILVSDCMEWAHDHIRWNPVLF